jgi:two-component system, NtrC family, nitrogen regulation sensor histidine kinase NtrY
MHSSAEGKLFWLLLLMLALGTVLGISFYRWFSSPWLAVLLVLMPGTLAALWLARLMYAPMRRLLRALIGAVCSYRDGDFSLSLTVNRQDELGELIHAHNALGNALREQRQDIVQRELLLDTVTQHSPVALVLVDSHRRVVYCNIAARHLLAGGSSLMGQDFDMITASNHPALMEAIASREDVLFSVTGSEQDETYHLAQRRVLLSAKPHQLYLIKRLTRELSRQEVAIWKKLIRALSHELNNSLAPIASLANSGAELARRGDLNALPAVFATIGERAMHLHEFLAAYATFARLPIPRPEEVNWHIFVDQLRSQVSFGLPLTLPREDGWFDRVQLEQVLINLLKNAQESGSKADDIELSVLHTNTLQRIEVCDRGTGMSEAVLSQALLPFYSTKRSGSGLGLALAREIVEAHGGHIRLANRQGGGLSVSLALPLRQTVPRHRFSAG